MRSRWRRKPTGSSPCSMSWRTNSRTVPDIMYDPGMTIGDFLKRTRGGSTPASSGSVAGAPEFCSVESLMTMESPGAKFCGRRRTTERSDRHGRAGAWSGRPLVLWLDDTARRAGRVVSGADAAAPVTPKTALTSDLPTSRERFYSSEREDVTMTATHRLDPTSSRQPGKRSMMTREFRRTCLCMSIRAR